MADAPSIREDFTIRDRLSPPNIAQPMPETLPPDWELCLRARLDDRTVVMRVDVEGTAM